MTKQTEAIKMALENSEPSILSPGWTLVRDEDIAALREALAEQPSQQEPVGKVNELFDEAVIEQCGFDRELLVYTSPPAQRTWVGLTDEERENVWRRVQANDFHDCVQPFARAIEAKLKEKNT